MIWTNVAWTDVAWTNVPVTVGIRSRYSQEATFKVWSKSCVPGGGGGGWCVMVVCTPILVFSLSLSQAEQQYLPLRDHQLQIF